jgi:hypothetical protein
MRSTLAGLVLVVSACGGAAVAAAEDAPYAEYRYLRDRGQIEITTGFIERTAELPSRVSALERTGVVVLETDRDRTFVRAERVGVHHVETTLSIRPPAGHGEGGASSNVYLRIVVDGKARVECPLSEGARGLDRLVLEPDRGFVTLLGHDGVLRYDGFEARGIVDADWLESRARFVQQLLRRSVK